ncbi:glycosyltransferase [bacterium]|nr:glycosyltransferase [bacterium]
MSFLIDYAPLFASHIMGYGYFVAKIGGYLLYRPYRDNTNGLKTAVVVPVYNEDAHLFRSCLESILNQSHQPDEIFIIDDASSNDECYQIAYNFSLGNPRITVHRFAKNIGKRMIHKWVVERSQADILANIDSDVIVQPHALEEALKPFANSAIQGVATHTTAINYRVNWLTRYLGTVLISQDFDRAALSVFDSAYATGRLCLFRTLIYKEYMNDYIYERFLGASMRTGDDSCMTRLAMRRGRVVYQETAHVQTPVAESLKVFLQQFLRWERNTLQTNLRFIMELKIVRPFWLFNVLDLFSRLLFGPLFVVGVIINPEIALKSFAAFYLIFLMLSIRGRTSVLNERMSWFWLLVAPILKVVQSMIATPIRAFALLTIRKDTWGTRQEMFV